MYVLAWSGHIRPSPSPSGGTSRFGLLLIGGRSSWTMFESKWGKINTILLPLPQYAESLRAKSIEIMETGFSGLTHWTSGCFLTLYQFKVPYALTTYCF